MVIFRVLRNIPEVVDMEELCQICEHSVPCGDDIFCDDCFGHVDDRSAPHCESFKPTVASLLHHFDTILPDDLERYLKKYDDSELLFLNRFLGRSDIEDNLDLFDVIVSEFHLRQIGFLSGGVSV